MNSPRPRIIKLWYDYDARSQGFRSRHWYNVADRVNEVVVKNVSSKFLRDYKLIGEKDDEEDDIILGITGFVDLGYHAPASHQRRS